jgi:hypothetical protein
MATTNIVQARITDQALEQLAADAEALGLENTSEALREGIVLLHRKAEQARLAQSYDDFYGGAPAPMSEATAALWGTDE